MIRLDKQGTKVPCNEKKKALLATVAVVPQSRAWHGDMGALETLQNCPMYVEQTVGKEDQAGVGVLDSLKFRPMYVGHARTIPPSVRQDWSQVEIDRTLRKMSPIKMFCMFFSYYEKCADLPIRQKQCSIV